MIPFYVSTLLFFLSFLDMNTSLYTFWGQEGNTDVTISINSENITFPFSAFGMQILDLGTPRTVDRAYIVSSPIRRGYLKCFLHSPSGGEISEIFHKFLPFSGEFQDAEYVVCYGARKDDISLVLLERANGIPIISKAQTKKRGTWDLMDVGSIDIRRAALIDPDYGVVKCEFKFTDGSIKSVREIQRLVDMVGTVEGLACREKWSFGDLLPFRRGN